MHLGVLRPLTVTPARAACRPLPEGLSEARAPNATGRLHDLPYRNRLVIGRRRYRRDMLADPPVAMPTNPLAGIRLRGRPALTGC